MAAARGLPIPPPDVVPPELDYRSAMDRSSEEGITSVSKPSKTLAVPIRGRAQSQGMEMGSSNLTPHNPAFAISPPVSPPASSQTPNPFLRSRSKTLASLGTTSKNGQAEMTPREFQLPKDPFVNGQPIEAYLYKDASECPICFIYYPPYLNTTRCCDQAICSECFVQIKRPDPHPPEHEQPDPNAPPPTESEREAMAEGLLVSEIACCPFCKQPDFGVSYVPPPFKRGLTYANNAHPFHIGSAMSSQTSLSSTPGQGSGRRRGTSLSANAPGVVTTDKIRPDWAQKLASARAHQARRSAAATALHTAAYMLNGQGQAESRGFGPFGRRTVLRRPTLEGESSAHMNALAVLAERHAQRQQQDGSDIPINPFTPPPRGSSSRRNRMDDLEDMMMMEAIRLSLASEEERRKKEEKDAKKEAKKKEKEDKKAEKAAAKAARKNSLAPTISNGSTHDYDTYPESSDRIAPGGDAAADEASTNIGKGKGVDRSLHGTSTLPSPDASQHLPININTASASSQAQSIDSQPSPVSLLASESLRRSHLRQVSNASSSASSFIDAPTTQAFTSGTPPGGGAGTEPMFNFRSLAAMIGEDEKGDSSSHIEDTGRGERAGSFEDLENSPSPAEGQSPSPNQSVEHSIHEPTNGKAYEVSATSIRNGNGSLHVA